MNPTFRFGGEGFGGSAGGSSEILLISPLYQTQPHRTMVSSSSSSSLTVESVPLLSPTFEQLDDGTELFSCRVKTGLWNRGCVKVDNGGVCVVEAIEKGSGPSSGTRRGESSTSSTSHEVVRQG